MASSYQSSQSLSPREFSWAQRWECRTLGMRNTASGLVVPIVEIRDKEAYFLGTTISLWFIVEIYTLRNSKGRRMFLMMTDPQVIQVFLSPCSPQIPSSPFFLCIIKYSLFHCVQFSATLVSKSQALQDHSKTIHNSHWEYRVGYNSPTIPRCQQVMMKTGKQTPSVVYMLL